MATTPGTIKHRHHSVLAPGTADIDVPEWNDSEVMAGGLDGQTCVRDSTNPDGWGWTPLVGTYAPLASPVFTGTPSGPTPAINNNTAQLAPTAWVLAQLAAMFTPSAFTPVDASGAGLAITGSGFYINIGKLVMFNISFNYPTTSNGANARIGGLPFASAVQAAGVFSYAEYAPVERMFIQVNQSYIDPVPAATNANMSGKTFIGNGWYFRL